MNLSQQLGRTVGKAHSLDEILAVAVAAVEGQMRCDACSIFLVDPGEKKPRLRAGLREGAASLAAFAPDVVEDLAGRTFARMTPETGREPGRSLLGVPMVLRGRAVGAVVVESAGGQAFSAEESAALE